MSDQQTLHLTAGGKSHPVTVTRLKSGSLALSFAYSKPLVTEVRSSLSGAKWHNDTKTWVIKDDARNRVRLSLMQGVMPKELSRYEAPPARVNPRRLLWAHQVSMFQFAVTRRCCIFAASMGVGKSISAIETMEWAAENLGYDQWIWLGPKAVLAAVELELEKWGSKVSPKLIHYDILTRELRKWKGPAPHGIIVDEASRIKSPTAQRSKSTKYLARMVREEHDGFVVLMSGTPAPKDPCDWWHLSEVACAGFLREGSVGALRERLAVIERVQLATHAFPKLVSWKMDEVDLLRKRLDGLVTVHLAEQCLDLPELRYERIERSPTPDVIRAARLLANTSLNAAQALNKCRQLSDGFLYDEAGPTQMCGSPKDQALLDLLERYEEIGRIIVYAAYTASIDKCVTLCAQAGYSVLRCDGRGWQAFEGGEPVDTDPKVYLKALDRSTDDGGIPKLAFVAQPLSGGLGLTLTAAPCSVYFSNDFNFESRAQSEKRSHRAGCLERGHTIYDLIHLPTDKLVLDNLSKKKSLMAVTLGEVMGVLV